MNFNIGDHVQILLGGVLYGGIIEGSYILLPPHLIVKIDDGDRYHAHPDYLLKIKTSMEVMAEEYEQAMAAQEEILRAQETLG